MPNRFAIGLAASTAAAFSGALAACVSSNSPLPDVCASSGSALCIDASVEFDGNAPAFDAARFADSALADTGLAPLDATVDSGAPLMDSSPPTSDSAATPDSGMPAADGAPRVPEGGPQTVLVTGQASPGPIAVGGGVLYWATATDDALWREPTGAPLNDGGSTTPIAFAPASKVVTLIADDANAYFATAAGDIYQVPHTSTTVTLLSGGQGSVGDMATDGTYLYWTSYEGSDAGGALARVPIGGPATPDGGGAILALLDHPHGVAVANGVVYFTLAAGSDNDEVAQLNPDGGAPVVLAGGQFFPWHVLADPTSIYWTDDDPKFSPASIYRANLDGTDAILWSNTAQHPYIALDSLFLYTLNGEGSFTIFDLTGHVYNDYPTTYTTGGLAMDGTTLYWTDPFNGRVWTAPKLHY